MNFYDEIAKEWDTPRRIERAKIISSRIAMELEGENYDKALEFGCGTGLISLNLANHFSQIQLMDSSFAMIEQLKHKISEYSIPNMEPIIFDLVEQEYSECFDCIYSSMVMHHIKDIDALFARFYSMLYSNGKICFVDMDKDDGKFHIEEKSFDGHHGFTHDEMTSYLLKAGFHDITVNTFYSSEKMIQGEPVAYSLFCVSGVK